ncbi:unnamed protein product [Coregonus sp. 'balchen']|nr:unnamed protein product [Coregonus sp. 'balchen']
MLSDGSLASSANTEKVERGGERERGMQTASEIIYIGPVKAGVMVWSPDKAVVDHVTMIVCTMCMLKRIIIPQQRRQGIKTTCQIGGATNRRLQVVLLVWYL